MSTHTRLIASAAAFTALRTAARDPARRYDRQTLRDWVHRYNDAGVDGVRDRPHPGRPCALDEGRQAALKALILKGPDPDRDGCDAWRIRDLCWVVDERFGVAYAETGMLRLVKGLSLSWQKARPRHPRASRRDQERFKGGCPA